MLYLLAKVAITAVLVVAISEVAKRSSLIGALLASLPLTSILAFVWLYVESGSTEKVAALSGSILWLVLPSLVLFLVLPWCLRLGWGFWLSLAAAALATAGAYGLMLMFARRFGIGE